MLWRRKSRKIPRKNELFVWCWEHTEPTLLLKEWELLQENGSVLNNLRIVLVSPGNDVKHFVNVMLWFNLCSQNIPQHGFLAGLSSSWRCPVWCHQPTVMFWWEKPAFKWAFKVKYSVSGHAMNISQEGRLKTDVLGRSCNSILIPGGLAGRDHISFTNSVVGAAQWGGFGESDSALASSTPAEAAGVFLGGEEAAGIFFLGWSL